MEYNNNFNNKINNINTLPANDNMRRIIQNNRTKNSTQIQKSKNDDNKLLQIRGEAYNFLTRGELVLDLKSSYLTWTVIDKNEMSDKFKKNYINKEDNTIQSIFTIHRDNITDVIMKNADDGRHLLKVELKQHKYPFFNFSFQDKNSKYIRDRFYNILKSKDNFKYYKTEFQMLSTETQNLICLLLNNKYLFQLYRKLFICYGEIEKSLKFIKYRYPEAININLGKNRIQLSRDEELIMLSQKKYNITKLINSDNNIYKSYKMESNIKNENFWENFIESQTGNKTYIVGGYKPSVCYFDNKIENEEEERNTNCLFEDLEKDKYYYDCYETNYLYYNEDMKNEQEKLKEKIKLLNNYSMNKIKNNNYFSYSSTCTSLYVNRKKPNKNKINKNNSNIKHPKEEKMEIEIDSNYRNRLNKEELSKKIKNMENEYNNDKNNNNINNYYVTMKNINENNYDNYNFAKYEKSLIPVEKKIQIYLNQIFLIKDLYLAQKIDLNILEKQKKSEDKISPEKNNKYEQIINQKSSRFNKEINNVYDNLKKKIENEPEGIKKMIEFLLQNVKSLNKNINNK